MTRQNTNARFAYGLSEDDVTKAGGLGAVQIKMRALFPKFPFKSLKGIVAWRQAVTMAEALAEGSRITDNRYERKRWAKAARVKNQTAIGQHFTFTENIGNGQTQPKPLSEQLDAFERECRTVFAESLRVAMTLKGDESNEETHEEAKQETKQESRKFNTDLDRYLSWVKDILRPFCEKQMADGHPIDEVGMRYAFDGGRMIAAGAPIDAVMDSVTMPYPDTARQTLGLQTRRMTAGVKFDFDFTSFGVDQWLDIVAKTRFVKLNGKDVGSVPCYLFGGKGTGKSTSARMLAERLSAESGEEIPFATVSMTLGTPPSAFYGRQKFVTNYGARMEAAIASGDTSQIQAVLADCMTDDDVTPSLFTQCFTKGGVFLFDEIDAGDPNLLLIVNAALANMHFANPVSGKEVSRHINFIPIAAGNTIGLGGGRDYVGRERLDAATLDRWASARFAQMVNTDLESQIASTIAYL